MSTNRVKDLRPGGTDARARDSDSATGRPNGGVPAQAATREAGGRHLPAVPIPVTVDGQLRFFDGDLHDEQVRAIFADWELKANQSGLFAQPPKEPR